MLTQYLRAAMHRAKYEMLEGDEGFYGSIPGLDGVWSNAKTLESCREELEQVLEDWILIRLSEKLPIPPVDGIELVVREVA